MDSDKKRKIKKPITTYNFIRHNIRITFGNKFVYFLLFAVLLFIVLMLISLFDNNIPNERGLYYMLIVPAVSLILYPAAYGVQTDKDMRSLEVLFGVPDYRFKVWLVRLGIVFISAYLIILVLATLCHFLIADIKIFRMAWQLMFPTLFAGTFAFMFSTVIKNGTGSAVTLVIILLGFLFFQELIEGKDWNLYLNPFADAGNRSELAWQKDIHINRLYLIGLSILFMLLGLVNLQKRESFLK